MFRDHCLLLTFLYKFAANTTEDGFQEAATTDSLKEYVDFDFVSFVGLPASFSMQPTKSATVSTGSGIRMLVFCNQLDSVILKIFYYVSTLWSV